MILTSELFNSDRLTQLEKVWNNHFKRESIAVRLEKEIKDIDSAIQVYEELAEDNTDLAAPYYRLSVLYSKLKRAQDEMRILEHAIWVYENIVYRKRTDRLSKIEKFKERLEKARLKIK